MKTLANTLANTIPPRGGPTMPPPTPAELDRQIAAAELAVVARDYHVQRRAHHITQRLSDHWPVALGVTLVVAFLLGRQLSPRRRADHADADHATAKAAPPPPAEGSLWQVLPMLWALMPEGLRQRLPTGTVALLGNIGGLLARKR